MKKTAIQPLHLLLLAGLISGCSGLDTSMTRMDRMHHNQGFQITADLSVVQRASMAVLTARGYQVSVKADPDHGAEEAGQIVIGERETTLDATGSAADGNADAATSAWAAGQKTDIKDLVNVYLSEKWQLDSDRGAPNMTLVNIVGGVYTQAATDPMPKEKELTRADKEALCYEIQHRVEDWESGVTTP
jgi:hypothetical protein